MSSIVAFGLGGNVGSDQEIADRLRTTRAALAEVFSLELELSPLCRTAPQGPVIEQASYINAAAVSRVVPDIPAQAVMAVILDLEGYLGRDRRGETAQGPRVIDIDLLLWGDLEISSEGPPDLCLPHPRMLERRFVLDPLAKLLGGDFVVAGTALSARLSQAEIAQQSLEWLT